LLPRWQQSSNPARREPLATATAIEVGDIPGATVDAWRRA
jgi:hypothetical protein